jgi:hypothetical protein
MTIHELESKLREAGVSDILIPGFVDQETAPVQFRPLPQAIGFQCESSVLRFEVIATTGTMRVSIDNSLGMPVELEDDMIAAVASLREQLLDDSDGSNPLRTIRFWNLVEDESGLRCAAAQLELANGQELFVDPTYHFGIRIGGTRQREIWRENWPDAKRASEHVIKLGAHKHT